MARDDESATQRGGIFFLISNNKSDNNSSVFEKLYNSFFNNPRDTTDIESGLSNIITEFKKFWKACIYDEDYKEEQAVDQSKINEIISTILHDEYEDGEISNSERFIQEEYKNGNIDNIINDLYKIYVDNYTEDLEDYNKLQILEGILVMLSSVPYEAVEPQGQEIAEKCLHHKDTSIQDRAIQCYSSWNSKKGLKALKSVKCNAKWLQKYADKIIDYIEKDGTN